jgi:flagellar hook-basal body complex protein FliE
MPRNHAKTPTNKKGKIQNTNNDQVCRPKSFIVALNHACHRVSKAQPNAEKHTGKKTKYFPANNARSVTTTNTPHQSKKH